MLQHALCYLTKGYTVIPVKSDKRPLIQWEQYQKQRPTTEQVEEWWKKWPDANIALITGKLSNLLVVDTDSQEATDRVQELIPESLVLPCQGTPSGGRHFFFQHQDGFVNRARVQDHIDIRTEGGYVVVAPSVNGNGNHWEWIVSLADINPPSIDLAISLKNILNSYYIYSIREEEEISHVSHVSHVSQNHFIRGSRNDDLFHLACCMVRGNAEDDYLYESITLLGRLCDPPVSEKEINSIIESAKKRPEKRDFNVSQWFIEWVKSQEGQFLVTDCQNESPKSISQKDKHTIAVTASRLCKDGVIERVGPKGKRSRLYKLIDNKIEYMDFINVDMEDTLDIKLPLDAHRKTVFFPKSVIVLAGVTGMGKTTYALNFIKDNMDRFETYYFNSEMSREALHRKLSYFKLPLEKWKMKAIPGETWDYSNVADKIFPDALNVIDYLEPEGEKPYGIHEIISSIVNKLNRGAALITVQKRPGSKLGTGGIYSAKASSFYLAMDWGAMEIIKNRYREEDINPRANFIDFEIVIGAKFESKTGWYDKSIKVKESKYDNFIKEN